MKKISAILFTVLTVIVLAVCEEKGKFTGEDTMNTKTKIVYDGIFPEHEPYGTGIGAFAETFREVVKTYGMPDVLFYNVGITVADEEVEISTQTLIDRYVVDVAGAYNCIKLADVEEFAEKKGAVLVTGGGLALHPYAGYLPLSMDKAALRAMVQALSPVLKEKGIYLGTVQVTGTIGSNDFYAPKTIAEEFWKLYTEQETSEIVH